MIECLKNGGTLFTCGNGGSHTQAMHFAEEWTGRFRKNRKPVASLALGDSSHVTCVGNDFGFDQIFSRQLEALGRKGDMVLLFTTSGQSPNLVEAAKVAKTKGIKCIGILGRDGGVLKNMVDLAIIVPAQSSDRIQEIHLKILHIAIESTERALFPENY
ncbi:MAG: SIS domain-containing protein [Proteobacteria bacterium]|nr:SIS domain-containing protein [Pseudomonadota bacterium]